MRTFEEVETTYTQMVEKRCDRCGKDLLTDTYEDQESISITHHCGYGSIWGDGNRVEIDLCQNCVEGMFGEYLRVYDGDIEV